MPKLSILVPTYNRMHYLKECIDSLLTTSVDCEIFVSNNASTDETDALMKSYNDSRIRYVCQSENIGSFRNIQYLFDHSQTEYICLFGDDDRVRPSAYAPEVAILDAHPEVSLVYAPFLYFDGKGDPLGTPTFFGELYPKHSMIGSTHEFQSLIALSCIQNQAIVFRRKLIEERGTFLHRDPDLEMSWDWAMFLRFCYGTKVAFVNRIGVEVRMHDNNHSGVQENKAAFLRDRIALWIHWLLIRPDPPTIRPDRWQLMRDMLVIDIQRAYGENPIELTRYTKQFEALKRLYTERMERITRIETHKSVSTMDPIQIALDTNNVSELSTYEALTSELTLRGIAWSKQHEANKTRGKILMTLGNTPTHSSQKGYFNILYISSKDHLFTAAEIKRMNTFNEVWVAHEAVHQFLHNNELNAPVFLLPIVKSDTTDAVDNHDANLTANRWLHRLRQIQMDRCGEALELKINIQKS